MQSSSSSLPFKQTLIGASPITDAISICAFGFAIYEPSANWKGRVNRQSQIVNPQPLCLSSYRASFVNSYSSVRVRPEAPFYQGRDVTVSISACDADCAGANPVALTILDGPKLIVYPHHKEGVPSVAKALAVRVRFPAWSASARSRHLSI